MFRTLDALAAEVQRLRAAYTLAEELRTLWGPYGPDDERERRKAAQATVSKLNAFFKHDDSE